jgi:D-alanyl-D-alanine carboxypeptidase (penicillin-binding protein 5/6)
VADQPAVSFAGVGMLANYLPAVGTNGVVGVKSGFTQAAMGCVVVAAQRNVQGHPVLFLAAVTGQQGSFDPIRAAQAQALAIIGAAAPAVISTTVLHPGQTIGTITTAWSSASHSAVTSAGLTILAWPGDTVHFTVQPAELGRTVRSGAEVGTLVVTDTSRIASVPIRITSAVSGPTWHWRFTRP